jgi:hypothetical protein
MDPTRNKALVDKTDAGPSFVIRGLQYGFVAGLLSSELYLACFAFITEGFTLDAVAIVLFGHVFGVLPAVILGSISGLASSIVLEPLKESLRGTSAAVLGAVIAALLLVPFALVIGVNTLEMQVEDLVTYLPIGALFVISGAIGGWRLTQDHRNNRSIGTLMIALVLLSALTIATALVVVSGS